MAFIYDGHVRNVDNLRLNVFVTFSLAAAAELPSDVIIIFILDRFGRRWIACITMAFSGLFSIWAALVTNSTFQKYYLIIK